MSTLANDAAFARPGSDFAVAQPGLTKREYFAALALQAFITMSPDEATGRLAPAAAVHMADRLIAELNKAKGQP